MLIFSSSERLGSVQQKEQCWRLTAVWLYVAIFSSFSLARSLLDPLCLSILHLFSHRLLSLLLKVSLSLCMFITLMGVIRCQSFTVQRMTITLQHVVWLRSPASRLPA